MKHSNKLSDKFEVDLKELEREISNYIEVNAFYLNFKKKEWAACQRGQILLALTRMAVNLRHDIAMLRKIGL